GSWWNLNRKDDLPSRTIKTLVFFIVSLKGDSILDHFTLIQNKDESELSYYVQKALRQKFDKSGTTTPGSATLKNDSINSNLDTPSRSSFDNNNNGNGNGNVKENHHVHPSPPQQQCRIPELTPRTAMKDFPLSVRQIQNPESVDGMISTTIPIVDNENLPIYCDHTAKNLEINELSHEMFHNYYRQSQQQQQQPIRIRNIDDAKRAVELAKQRLDHFKTYLNNNDNNNRQPSNHD
ncbi:hypothetical protein BLA29_006769, partial [Euroglyphus maynei]